MTPVWDKMFIIGLKIKICIMIKSNSKCKEAKHRTEHEKIVGLIGANPDLRAFECTVIVRNLELNSIAQYGVW